MALYIPIDLIEQCSESVTYQYSQPVLAPDPVKPKRFTVVGRHVGHLVLDKSTGTVSQLSGDDWDKNGTIFRAAAAKVMKNHLQGRYPEATAYEA